jgi:hypothetical protein
MKRFLALTMVAFAFAAMASGMLDRAAAQNDAPKPSVTVQGTTVYLGKVRDNITVTLTKQKEPSPAGQDDKPEEEKPATSTTNEKGEYEFKNVAVGKYQLTAKGRPANSIRAFREADPVNIEITADTTSPVTKTITLTLDKGR